MTRRLRIDLRLRAPLCIARRPTAPGQPIETLAYISGTVLRGGLASAWLQGRRYEELTAAQQDLFAAVFMGSSVRFGNCLPQISGAETVVVPATAWARKHAAEPWLADDGEGVQDQLVTLLSDSEPNPTLKPLDQPFSAYRDSAYTRLPLRKRLIARTAIDPERGTARDQQLYTFEVLETGQIFSGQIVGDNDAIVELEQGVLRRNQQLTLGQGRSRGMGSVTIEEVEEREAATDERATLREQIEHFNTRLSGSDQQSEVLLPVTLESDLLLRDYYLLPSSDPQPAQTLGRYQPGAPASLQIEWRGILQSARWIGGWDELRRLPCSPQLAVQMGSVWTFRVGRAELDPALDWWIKVAQQGLGERCNEGFGQIRLCHPFHLAEGSL